ncbi:hypothetical protein V5O48_003846 [Marasmius crinis-equi]|uniref:CST complex subunit STN1 n=1 Tax=Marasmius crinis-equi TaxID=585013 RepID=A0ABR3FRQ9_9AGAR
MSLTSILEQHSNTTGSVLLTPRKRRAPTPQDLPVRTEPTNADIFKWVFTSGAVAPCFVRDVFQMRHHQDKVEDFFWLKRVPCRSVRLTGMVVGIQGLMLSQVDDGTSVIDCLHRCSAPRAQSPSKSSHTKSNRLTTEPLPKPVAYIGHTVRVVGRVAIHFETRQITVDSIDRCKSANDQHMHWKTVLDLHKTYYSLDEPFILPPNGTSSSLADTRESTSLISQTPQMSSHSSPSTSTAPSPTKSTASTHQSPRKLRHPSRLHSRDLTPITFRIYVKHFMDNCSPPVDDDSMNEFLLEGIPATPTKPRNRIMLDDDEERTPRPSRLPPAQLSHCSLASSNRATDRGDQQHGFPFSFLRRVPELSDMARRVVRAEDKRRDKEARKKEKEINSSTRIKSVSSGILPSTSRSRSGTGRDKPISAKMKELWVKTIRQLLLDGGIVIWTGSRYPTACAHRMSTPANVWRERSMSSLNLTASTSVMSDGSSLFSAAIIAPSSAEQDQAIAISDPESDEEAYVPLTPQFLAIEVERTIPKVRVSTKHNILSYLHRDGQWEHVGEWNVAEALQVLEDEGRAWVDRSGVWDLVL